MKGRVGIVTLYGNQNFGNRLQNYALQRTIQSIGFPEVQTLKHAKRNIATADLLLERVDRLHSLGPGGALKRIAGRFRRGVPEGTADLATQEAIVRFVRSHIDETEFDYADVRHSEQFRRDYDFFVVGSDQVWAPPTYDRETTFLQFASPSQRIAYAASFGLDRVPYRLTEAYRSGIRGMAHVSVREERGAQLVREIAGRDAEVVLDPTMLLPVREWEELAIIPDPLRFGGYIAEFFLGSSAEADMEPVVSYARRNGLDRVNLRGDSRLERSVTIGPLEFIGAIKQSSVLVTDSFHAAVFATIFSIPYLLKGRGAMTSRFDTLLSKSGLAMPRWRNIRELEASVDIDWSLVRDNLAREKTRSIANLEIALTSADL